jgi:hypothetical protein
MDSCRKVNISLLTDDSLSQSFWEQVAIPERFWIFGREARDQSIKNKWHIDRDGGNGSVIDFCFIRCSFAVGAAIALDRG